MASCSAGVKRKRAESSQSSYTPTSSSGNAQNSYGEKMSLEFQNNIIWTIDVDVILFEQLKKARKQQDGYLGCLWNGEKMWEQVCSKVKAEAPLICDLDEVKDRVNNYKNSYKQYGDAVFRGNFQLQMLGKDVFEKPMDIGPPIVPRPRPRSRSRSRSRSQSQSRSQSRSRTTSYSGQLSIGASTARGGGKDVFEKPMDIGPPIVPRSRSRSRSRSQSRSQSQSRSRSRSRSRTTSYSGQLSIGASTARGGGKNVFEKPMDIGPPIVPRPRPRPRPRSQSRSQSRSRTTSYSGQLSIGASTARGGGNSSLYDTLMLELQKMRGPNPTDITSDEYFWAVNYFSNERGLSIFFGLDVQDRLPYIKKIAKK